MSHAQVKLEIGGDKIIPHQVIIDQRYDGHHQFEIKVTEIKARAVIEDVEKGMGFIGKEMSISIRSDDKEIKNVFSFSGVVTEVSVLQRFSEQQLIIFKGYSPTVLLDGHPTVETFEELSPADISKKMLGNFKVEVNPKYKKKIPYITCYRETKWQFLSRLADSYGEWCYYDGDKVVFGDFPGKTASVNLKFGSSNHLSFEHKLSLRPYKFKTKYYQYTHSKTDTTDAKPGSLDSHADDVKKAADRLFKEEGLDPMVEFIKDKDHQKHLTDVKTSSKLSDTSRFSGESTDPGISIGARVHVESLDGYLGDFRVIAAKHHYQFGGEYFNTFESIPVKALIPPANKAVENPVAEEQMAVVMDNNDPEKLGRVRVRFKWQEDGLSPWVRVLAMHAGKKYGTYFVPEIDDEVMVGFEQGNPDRPYIIGSKYHKDASPEFFDSSNNLKAIKTRSGHLLQFDDSDGQECIWITDKKGNELKIETADNKITINAGDSIIIKAGKSIDLKSDQSINISTSNFTLSAKSSVKIDGSTCEIKAKGQLDVEASGQVNVKGSGMLNLESSGITMVKGSLVKIN